MGLIKKVTDSLLRPFSKNWPLLMSLWCLSSFADLVGWFANGDVIFAGYLAVHGLVVSYALVWLLGLFNNKGKVFIIVLGIINLIVDSTCYVLTRNGFTNSTVALIMGTNSEEIGGFFTTYFDWKIVIVVGAGLLLAFIPLFLSKRLNWKIPQFVSVSVFVLFLALASVTVIRKSKNYPGVFLCKVLLFLEYDTPEDLSAYRQTIKVKHVGRSPENIVFVLGESIARSHCSLYGYNRETQPCLTKLIDSDNLYVYDNVRSAAQWTVESIITLMTSAKMQDVRNGDWMSKIYLFDLMKAAGYKCYWLTNQSLRGVGDNMVAKFAELADSMYCTHTVAKTGRLYDGDVLQELSSLISSNDTPSFYIIHQMGAHEHFSDRYPESFNFFQPSDYLEYAGDEFELDKRDMRDGEVINRNDKLKVMAQYDNSVLYNDHVVSELMHSFDGREAVVVYFPDHGMDIFQTDPHYAGHAIAGSPKSLNLSSEIPMMIYVTDEYKNAFPEMVDLMKSRKQQSYTTDNMIYTFMDLASIRLEEEVDSLSLLRQ